MGNFFIAVDCGTPKELFEWRLRTESQNEHREHILKTLEITLINIGRSTLYGKMKKSGIEIMFQETCFFPRDLFTIVR